MPDRNYRTSVSGIAVALGLAATPLAAQQTEGAADLLATYPELADIEDRTCLEPLADYEARQGEGALGAVLQGEVTAADLPDADEDLVRCIRAAEQVSETAEAPEPGAQAPEAAAEMAPDQEIPAEAEGGAEATAEAPDQIQAPAAEALSAEDRLAAEDQVAEGEEAAVPGEADDGPEAIADVAPEAEADVAPEAEADVAPEAEADVAPEAEADVAPEAEADVAPEAIADVAPDEPEAEAADEAAPAGIEMPMAEGPGTEEPEAAPQVEAETEAGAAAGAAVPSEAVSTAEAEQDGTEEEALRKALETEQAAEVQEAGETDAATLEAAEAEPTADAVQEDTVAAMEAANEPVTVQAAAEDGAAAEAEDVETAAVTEETVRTSAEEFDVPAGEQPSVEEPTGQDATVQEDDDDRDIRFGQVAAGVLGGLILGEVLGANEEVVANTGDRVVVERGDGDYYVLKDENALLRQPGTEVTTQRFSDGSLRETLTRADGTRIVTVLAPNGQVVRRERILPDGQRVVLFDDTRRVEPVGPAVLRQTAPEYVEFSEDMDTEALRRALALEETRFADRRFSLRQVRDIRAVRNLVPTLQLESINFETGSAAIRPSEAEEFAEVGRTMRRMIEENPYEVFLVEGHTDAVGSAAYNLALSDRRAESVALALSEYFDVPPENMVVQGYGESNLRVPTAGPERANRRAAVRRITPLLNSASLR